MTTTSEAKSFAGDGALKLFSDAPGYDEVVKRFVVEMWNGDDASGCIVTGDAVEEVLGSRSSTRTPCLARSRRPRRSSRRRSSPSWA